MKKLQKSMKVLSLELRLSSCVFEGGVYLRRAPACHTCCFLSTREEGAGPWGLVGVGGGGNGVGDGEGKVKKGVRKW